MTAGAYGDAAPLISKFRVSETAIENLRKCNITRLFPIQATTFDYIYDGDDVIGRARTGEGKTLSFVLPVIEKIRSMGANPKTPGELARNLFFLYPLSSSPYVCVCDLCHRAGSEGAVPRPHEGVGAASGPRVR